MGAPGTKKPESNSTQTWNRTKAICHYCRQPKEKCRCFERGIAIMPAEKDAQRFTKVLPKEDGKK